METPLTPVGSPLSLEKLAYNAIKQAIITFRFKPGQSMVESDLAKQLGISKTPVRDALMKLEKEGFVVKKPYTGTYVAEITKKSIIDIFEIRANLEGLAAKFATDNLKSEEINSIQETINQLTDAVKHQNLSLASQWNNKYHQLIIRLADNEWLTQILLNFEDHLQRMRILSNYQSGRLQKSVDEHQAVLDAMIAGNASDAESAMHAHLISALEDLKKQDIDDLVKQACQQAEEAEAKF